MRNPDCTFSDEVFKKNTFIVCLCDVNVEFEIEDAIIWLEAHIFDSASLMGAKSQYRTKENCIDRSQSVRAPAGRFLLFHFFEYKGEKWNQHSGNCVDFGPQTKLMC